MEPVRHSDEMAEATSPAKSTLALSDLSDSESDAAPQTEWLATAREKRSTAGNRMKSMLANEEPDSDLELLFAEDENDQGFSDAGEDGSDVQMDSSSDDEDNNAGDDMEGEKELERQAKEKRAAQRKRKAQDAIPAKFRKKVRITTEAPAARPKKKSERASWLPSAADLPTRASSRQTTRLSKESLHQQMVEREARRLRQVAQMQKKAAKLEASRKPPKTQEERLREAEEVELRNSKSLNRWEEAEKLREEERMRKLAALNERTLDGPVITFWSGLRQGGGRATYVSVEEKPIRKKREKPSKKTQEKDALAQTDALESGNMALETSAPKENEGQKQSVGGESDAAQPANSSTSTEAKEAPEPVFRSKEPTSPTESKELDTPPTTLPTTATEEESVRVSEEETPRKETEAAVKPSEKAEQETNVPNTDKVISQTNSAETISPIQPAQASGTADAHGPSTVESKAVTVSNPATIEASTASTIPDAPTQLDPAQAINASPSLDTTTALAAPTVSGADPVPATSAGTRDGTADDPGKETSTRPSEQPPDDSQGELRARNGIVFQNFDDHALRDKSVQTQILFGQKMGKLASKSRYPGHCQHALTSPEPAPAPVCVITRQHARYRDPSTGLPFATAQAYREIRRLIKGDYRWSKILGAWVGTGSCAAKGVPERFLNPAWKKLAETKPDEGKQGDRKPDEIKTGQQESQAAGQSDGQPRLEKPAAPAPEPVDAADATKADGRPSPEGPSAQPETQDVVMAEATQT